MAMASMVFASSPLSFQSHVKLRTNSNYPISSSCYVPSPSKTINNSYIHLSYKNSIISHIDSSKSSFTKGDGNFSLSLPKFPRVASTLYPSLNIIKASVGEDIYHYKAYDVKKNQYISLKDRYEKKILLIVNIPKQGSKWTSSEVKFLNALCNRYKGRKSIYNDGFEVLGFLYDKDDLKENSDYGKGENEIIDAAEFSIFEPIPQFPLNKKHGHWYGGIFHDYEREEREDLWFFLRDTIPKYEEKNIGTFTSEFEKFLINGDGKLLQHYPRFDYETLDSQSKQDGGDPGPTAGSRPDPKLNIQDAIDDFFKELRK